MAEVDIKLPYKLPTFHNWQPHALFYHPLYAGSIDGTDLYPHDKAVIRAMLSTYKPNKNVSGDPSKTLFVARLSKDTTKDTIQNIFEKFGELEKCRLIRDFVTGFSKGYAFVEFKRKKDALNAARETHRMEINGKQILVDFESERTLDGWKPRRFGGGFGGRKESGQLRFGGIDRPFRRPIPVEVNHFSRSGAREGSVNKSSQDSRGYRTGDVGDQGRMNRDRERYHDRERDRQGCDKDRRGYYKDRDERDRRGYRTERGSSDKGHKDYGRDREEHRDRRGSSRDRDDEYRNRRGSSRDREDDDGRKERDKRDYRDKDYRRHRDDRRDRDDRYRTGQDRHDRDDRYRDRRHRDKEDNRDTRDEIRSESSNSSRDPE